MARGQVWKRRSGAYAIRYRGPDGKRHYEHVGHVRKDEAEARLTAVLHDIDLGVWRPPSSETLREFGERWLARKKARLAPSTIDGYRGYLERIVYPKLGDRRLRSLRPEDFDELVSALEAEGRPAGTVRNALVPLRSMLSDAVRLGKLATNPAARVELPPAPDGIGKEIPERDLVKLRKALAATAPDDPYRPGERDLIGVYAFDLTLSAGLRLSELAGLRWRACDFDARTITVEEAIVRGKSKRPKGKKAAIVPMFDGAQQALRALAARAVERGRYGPDELVVTTMRGTPIDPSNWYHRIWEPALTKAGFKSRGYRWHDLRVTATSRLASDPRIDVGTLQAFGRWSDPRMVARYMAMSKERTRALAKRFEPGLRAPTGHHGS